MYNYKSDGWELQKFSVHNTENTIIKLKIKTKRKKLIRNEDYKKKKSKTFKSFNSNAPVFQFIKLKKKK